MNELNQLSDVNQKVNNIKEEITRSEPSSTRIITHLCDLRIKEEYQSLSDSEFYDIVGETFKLNPEFFMKSIYRGLKLRKNIYANINNREMEKYIIEKFCLYEGEQILYECNGAISQTKISTGSVGRHPSSASVAGRIYVTNYRIIAHGTLSASGGRLVWGGGLLALGVEKTMTGHGKRAKSKTSLYDGSTSQELPCYGYQFPIKNHVRLKKKRNNTRYVIVDKVENMSNASASKQVRMLMNACRVIEITLTYSTYKIGKGYHINKLFELLCKDANQTVDSLRELHEMGLKGRIKQKEFLYRLRKLWNSEEYQHLSDSDCLDIVIEIYKLDPEFFMTSIYPKMGVCNFPDYIRKYFERKRETL